MSGQYRQSVKNDFCLTPRLRIGKSISNSYNTSIDFGYSIYSARHLSFPGYSVRLNIDKTNQYGFHVRFDEFSGNKFEAERNIVLGLHLSGRNTVKIGLPILGGITLLATIAGLAISGSK